MKTNELVSVVVAVIVLAGIAVAIVNGGQTAQVLKAGSDGFSQVIKTASSGGK